NERPVPAEEAAAAREHATPLDSADQALVDWYDTLEFPNLAKRPFVRVRDDIPVEPDEEPLLGVTDAEPEDRSFPGFLLSDDIAKFTVFRLDLVTSTLTRKGAAKSPNDWRLHRFEVVDLEQEASAKLEQLRAGPRTDDFRRGLFGSRTTERTEVFVLARGCAANGLTGLAHELIAEAARLPDSQTG